MPKPIARVRPLAVPPAPGVVGGGTKLGWSSLHEVDHGFTGSPAGRTDGFDSKPGSGGQPQKESVPPCDRRTTGFGAVAERAADPARVRAGCRALRRRRPAGG